MDTEPMCIEAVEQGKDMRGKDKTGNGKAKGKGKFPGESPRGKGTESPNKDFQFNCGKRGHRSHECRN